MQRFEYKFVRLEQSYIGFKWLGVPPAPSQAAMESYQGIVVAHAKDGWRLVQVFAPGTGTYGAAIYLELIFERPFELRQTNSTGESHNAAV